MGMTGARAAGSVWLLVAALVLAACQGLPNPLATPVPPDALHPDGQAPLLVAPDPAPADPAKVGELERHRTLWNSLRILDYSMTIIYGCVCDLAGRPIDVTVAGGQLVSATDAGEPLELERLTGFPASIDALFDYAARNANAGKIEFAWDDHIGIPTAVGVDPDLAARDDEVRIAILEFSPTH